MDKTDEPANTLKGEGGGERVLGGGGCGRGRGTLSNSLIVSLCPLLLSESEEEERDNFITTYFDTRYTASAAVVFK